MPMAGLLVLAAGCVVEGGPFFDQERGCADVMFDSVGNAYPVEDNCFPGAGPDSPRRECTDGRSPGLVFTYGNVLFSACPSCDAGFGPSGCRPLICETDDDCPYFYTQSGDDTVLNVYHCERGLCVNEGRELVDEDGTVAFEVATQLCRALVERDESYEGPPWCEDDAEQCSTPLPDSCWPL